MNTESKKILNLYKVIQENKSSLSKELVNEVTIEPPLDVMPKKINHPYGEKRSYEIHPGVDLGTRSGTPVKAPMDGEVVNVNENGRLCGGTIDIDYKNGFWSRFCHIKRIDVKKGDVVKQGQVVGLSGGIPGEKGAGNSKGAHLHFTLKKDGKLVDPMDYIGKDVMGGIVQNTPSGASDKDENSSEIGKIVDKLGDKVPGFVDLKSFGEKWGNTFRKAYEKAAFGLAEQEIKRIKELLK